MQWFVGVGTFEISQKFQPNDFGVVKKVELYHPSNASTNGYVLSSYLRLLNEVFCSLVLGKSRVTPLLEISIPPLVPAVSSVRIADVLKSEFQCDIFTEYFWNDRNVVLGYIANDARYLHSIVRFSRSATLLRSVHGTAIFCGQ